MADYFQVKNQNIFNPPANTFLGNVTNQYNSVYVENDLVLGNVTVTGATIIAPRVTTIAYPGDDTAADTAAAPSSTGAGAPRVKSPRGCWAGLFTNTRCAKSPAAGATGGKGASVQTSPFTTAKG